MSVEILPHLPFSAPIIRGDRVDFMAHGRCHAGADLKNHPAVRHHAPDPSPDPPVDIEPVAATVERQHRIVVTHLDR